MTTCRWGIRGVVLIVLVAVLGLAACGGGDDSAEEGAPGTAEDEGSDDADADADADGDDADDADGDDEGAAAPALLLEDDFSDPGSGFPLVSDEINSIAYEDGGLRFVLTGNASTSLPLEAPLPSSGSITVTIEGDLGPGYAGICLGGETGQYEFAIAPGGYASLGYYPETTGDYGEFDLIDEVRDAYPTTGSHEVRARWRSEGGATDLAVDVDGETLVVSNDDTRVTDFTFAALCATVGSEAPEASVLTVTYDDLVMTGEG